MLLTQGLVVIAKTKKKEGEDYEEQAAFARRGCARDSAPGARRKHSNRS
jgi:hypothetical protein